MPSAHLCSPVTRVHRSVLTPLDARALLHHYPMPLAPAFTPLARPAPPPCLPSLYALGACYCGALLAIASSLYAPREFESPRGVGEGPPQGAAPDPPDAGSSQTHIRVHPLRVHSILPLSPLPPPPLAGRRRRRLCCRLHRHRLRRRRRHRRCYRHRSRRRSCRSPPLTSPNTTHHPPTVGGPRQRHKGGKGGGGRERGAGPRGRGWHRSLWRADAVRWPHSWPSRAECCGACAVAHMGTWNMSVCRPPPRVRRCGDGVLLCVGKILSNMCSILMSGYQTKAYHLISRSEVFLSPGRVSALQGAGNMIRKPPNQAASAHRGLRSRSHWGVG